MDKVWFRPLVWLDYRLALLFLVIIPVILLIWVLVQKAEVIQRLLIIYWRVSSLLAITVYLGIGEFGVSFISGLMARILIPISLWFWVDLNDEIEDQPMSPLKLIFTSWRWAVSVYCGLSALASIPFLVCAFSETAIKTDFCRVWFEPPLLYKDYFHHNTKPGFLGFIGIIALIAYVLYLSYFVIIKLGKQGRSATQ
ncbi:DUF3177 family protein [Iningainema tapete]|uniref:DUF3177 family protein n=1 Tax=Iningainema tapete BLCC-T55 TaxID=2748662 RepID=A0A8J6XFT7_9CYAN|nr:DUF3177 family protein [Iningainema tapete]MBD2771732.1 DUF3177 family protein [Iningainema tapete BLCC-T55]